MERRERKGTWAIILGMTLLLAQWLGPDLGFGAVGEEFPILTGPEHTWSPAVAFDPASQRYLVVYEGPWGLLLNANGTPIGPSFQIGTCCGGGWPAVAYDSVNRRFLVVWHWWGNDFIKGQLVNPDGTLSGGEILIASGAAPGEKQRPSVAFDSTSQRFLVAWQYDNSGAGNDADIWGQMVNADGSLMGANFSIATGPDSQWSPSVAADPSNGRFLAVYQGCCDQPGVRGQLVNNNGTLFGTSLTISPDCCGWRGEGPGLAYDSVNRRFLVAWSTGWGDNAGRTIIKGQLANADGSPFGPAFSLSSVPGKQSDDRGPRLAFDPTGQRFLVAWWNTFSNNLYGQLVNTNGSLAGINAPLSTAPDTQDVPSTAYDSANKRFLVAWGDHRNGNPDVYGIILTGLPVKPCAALLLNQDNFRIGDPLKLDVRVLTPPQTPPGGGNWKFEAAIWLKTPAVPPGNLTSLLDMAGSNSVGLPASLDQTFNFLNLSLPPMPTGSYEFGLRINNIITREELCMGSKPFNVLP
ncbi:MAG: hypothetical protein HYS70_04490 [Nitrospinae bacterium]|nr:hypothetical protein [Nitrospinota bacterium]